MEPRLEFREVPPPKEAPWHEIGETLGLCKGLRPQRTDSQYRCAACSKMQPPGSWMVWVPDSVRRGDPAWSVIEAARLNAYNGHLSGWCITCAPKAEAPKVAASTNPATEPAPASWWDCIRSLFPRRVYR